MLSLQWISIIPIQSVRKGAYDSRISYFVWIPNEGNEARRTDIGGMLSSSRCDGSVDWGSESCWLRVDVWITALISTSCRRRCK